MIIRASVAELPDNRDRFELAWASLIQHVDFAESDIVALPELPASAWFGVTQDANDESWSRVVAEHDDLLANLTSFGNAIVIGTRATLENGVRHNVAFYWTRESGVVDLHPKAILPEDAGFYEQSWYSAGPINAKPVRIRNVTVGVLICSELMATDLARQLGNAGAQIIVVPRASQMHPRWEVASRMAAITSGAYVLTSNRVGLGIDGRTEFGGRAMIVDPDGTLLGETGQGKTFATAALDMQAVETARTTYPRYLKYGF
jgi:N-carbamoylputrescine amidase